MMKLPTICVLAAIFTVVPWPQTANFCLGQKFLSGSFGYSQAWADDDGDDDADNGGAGGVGGASQFDKSGSGQAFWKAKKKRKIVRKAKPTKRINSMASLPKLGRLAIASSSEIISRNLTEIQVAEITRRGFLILERRVQANGLALTRIRPKVRQSLRAAREEIRSITGAATADFNHYYRLDSDEPCRGSNCGPLQLIGLQRQNHIQCPLPKFAVIDSHVDEKHAFLLNSNINQLELVAAGQKPLKDGHGTAVAALLAADSIDLKGAFPGADFLSINIFHVGPGGDRRADAFSLIAAIEEIRKRGINIVNLSLSGPDNEPLRQSVGEAVASGVHLVAAVGNAGPASNALYPAGYNEVIAVTALDQRLRVYRRAVRGAHVDFSAPGVEIASAGPDNRRSHHTGTSFSTPFVTAAVVATITSKADLKPVDTIALLAGRAKDLGSVGRDKVFGYGLVQVPEPCR